MKISLVILFCIVLMTGGMVKAQQVQLNDVVSFEMPAGSKKISHAAKAAFARRKEIQVVGMPKDQAKVSYLLDEVIISLSAGHQPKKSSLEDMKKGQDEMSRDIPGHISRYVQVNGNEFLTSQNPLTAKIWFYGIDSSGMNMLFGVLEFNEKNRGQANTALDRVLKGIVYKP